MQTHKQIIDIVLKDKLLLQTYQLHKILGYGTFGVIYQATHLQSSRKSALKLQIFNKESFEICSLKNQYQILLKLQGIVGIPKVYNFSKGNLLIFLEMELLVGNYKFLVNKQNIHPLDQIIGLGIKVIQILQKIHQKKIIHRDLKPQNIMYNRNKEIYLIDFGLSYSIQQQTCNNSFIGTLRYASKNAHKCKSQTQKDDIQSCIYMLTHMIKQTLPWIKFQKQIGKQAFTNILQLKQKNLKQYTKNFPPELKSILDYLDCVGFGQLPNYVIIKQLLVQSLSKKRVIKKVVNVDKELCEQIFNEGENGLGIRIENLSVFKPKFMSKFENVSM